MEQLLQVRVLVQTIDTRRVVQQLPCILNVIYNENIPEGISIEELIEEIQSYSLRSKDISDEMIKHIGRISMLHKALQDTLANWEPSRASTLSISLEEALYSLNALLDR